MRILLISAFYPPQNAIASQRAYTWAKYWRRAGVDVTVLTPTKDLSRPDLSPQPLEGVTLVEVAPWPIFKWLKKLVRRRVQPPPVISVRTPLDQAPSQNRSFIQKMVLKLAARGLFSSTRMPDPFDFWIVPAFRAASTIEHDVVVSTFGPYAPLVVAYFLKRRRPDVVWVCDFRDLWVKNHNYSGLWGFCWLEKWLEKKFVRSCDFVTTVSDALAAQLRADYPGLDVRVISNGFDVEDLARVDLEPAFDTGEIKRIVYTGSLNPLKQDVTPFFEALAKLSPGQRASLRVIFVGPNVSRVAELAERIGISNCIEFRASVPRFESLRLQRDADRLLFVETQYEAARDGVLTGKLFEYLSSGTRVIGVGITSASVVGRWLTDYQAGVAFGTSVEGINRELEVMLNEPRSSDKKMNPAIMKFSRERQAADLLKMIRAALG